MEPIDSRTQNFSEKLVVLIFFCCVDETELDITARSNLRERLQSMAWSFAAAPSSSFPTAYLRSQVAQGPATKNNSAVLLKPVSSEKHLCYCKAAAHSEGVAEEDAVTGIIAITDNNNNNSLPFPMYTSWNS